MHSSSPAADDDTITAEELQEALLQIRQSVEDAWQRKLLEAAIEQRIQQQAEERRRALLQILLYMRSVE